MENDNSATPMLVDAFQRVLGEIAPDWAIDPGLTETPARMARAWTYWTGGKWIDIASLLKTFPAPAGASEMIVVRDLPFFSLCEHHGAPFFGTASVAYIPQDRILGLSKIGRVVDAFARRMQTQERLTNQVADALDKAAALKPVGVGVIISARHLCMESRGLAKQGQTTVTSALRGAMQEGAARAEFLALAH